MMTMLKHLITMYSSVVNSLQLISGDWILYLYIKSRLVASLFLVFKDVLVISSINVMNLANSKAVHVN
jgi:hypothetical protein